MKAKNAEYYFGFSVEVLAWAWAIFSISALLFIGFYGFGPQNRDQELIDSFYGPGAAAGRIAGQVLWLVVPYFLTYAVRKGLAPYRKSGNCDKSDRDPLDEEPAAVLGSSDSKNQLDAATEGSRMRVFAGILGILFGCLGIHKFLLGYVKEGAILFYVTVLSLGALSGVTALIGLIEGVIYLTKGKEKFASTYVIGKKGWF